MPQKEGYAKESWPTSEQSHEYYAAEITKDNRLMVLITPQELKDHLPFMKNVLNLKVLDSLGQNDNPILVEIKLK